MTPKTSNPLYALANWAAGTPNNWSDLALGRALEAFIDTIAVMIPGAQEKVATTLAPLAEKWGKGTIPAAGTGVKAHCFSTPMAALIGGTSAHALDFDDNFDPAKAHASAVLVPAILAAGYDRASTGPQMLDAYIVGLQIMGHVGQALNPYHRSRGWHATGTVGALGASAAIGRLIGLNAEKMTHAISLSTSYAGGFMSQFGTMAKPMHAGLAASGGVQAAEAAEAGITAGDRTLHGRDGMGTLMVGPDREKLSKSMIGKAEHGQTVSFSPDTVGTPLHIEKYGLKVKRYPNCGSVNRAVDGILELRETHAITPDMVDRILVRAPAAHLNNLMYENPENGLEAKFSLEYNIALGLLTGNNTLDDYKDEAVKKDSVRALMSLVHKEYVDQLESDYPTEIHVTFKSGKSVMTVIEMPIGSTQKPLSRQQLWEKFLGCTAGILTSAQQEKTQQAMENLEREGSAAEIIASLAL